MDVQTVIKPKIFNLNRFLSGSGQISFWTNNTGHVIYRENLYSVAERTEKSAIKKEHERNNLYSSCSVNRLTELANELDSFKRSLFIPKLLVELHAVSQATYLTTADMHWQFTVIPLPTSPPKVMSRGRRVWSAFPGLVLQGLHCSAAALFAYAVLHCSHSPYPNIQKHSPPQCDVRPLAGRTYVSVSPSVSLSVTS